MVLTRPAWCSPTTTTNDGAQCKGNRSDGSWYGCIEVNRSQSPRHLIFTRKRLFITNHRTVLAQLSTRVRRTSPLRFQPQTKARRLKRHQAGLTPSVEANSGRKAAKDVRRDLTLPPQRLPPLIRKSRRRRWEVSGQGLVVVMASRMPSIKNEA